MSIQKSHIDDTYLISQTIQEYEILHQDSDRLAELKSESVELTFPEINRVIAKKFTPILFNKIYGLIVYFKADACGLQKHYSHLQKDRYALTLELKQIFQHTSCWYDYIQWLISALEQTDYDDLRAHLDRSGLCFYQNTTSSTKANSPKKPKTQLIKTTPLLF